MALTILSVAYPLVPVSPDTAGGAEQIVCALDRSIVQAGHRSIVIAAAGSRVRGALVETPGWPATIDANVRRWAAEAHRRAISEALGRFSVDVVHLHGLDFLEYLPEEPVAALATLHLPPQWYPPEIFSLNRARTWFNCVSSDQRRRCPASVAPVETIVHGIDVDGFARPARKRGYALALGRICPEKGFHFAIAAARAAGVPLLIAGQVFEYAAHREYFERQIAPYLGRCARFLGPAGLRTKQRLLRGARCVLIPSTAPETSSLVAMEALASGTPVVAFDSGALSEIVEHGRTGMIVNNEREMAEAMLGIGALRSEDCRRAARARFSEARMAEQYLELYARIARVSAGAVRCPVGEVFENRTGRPVVRKRSPLALWRHGTHCVLSD